MTRCARLIGGVSVVSVPSVVDLEGSDAGRHQWDG
jgi:hypothetical protein